MDIKASWTYKYVLPYLWTLYFNCTIWWHKITRCLRTLEYHQHYQTCQNRFNYTAELVISLKFHKLNAIILLLKYRYNGLLIYKVAYMVRLFQESLWQQSNHFLKCLKQRVHIIYTLGEFNVIEHNISINISPSLSICHPKNYAYILTTRYTLFIYI